MKLLFAFLLLAIPAWAQGPEFIPVADVEKTTATFTSSTSGPCWEVPFGTGYHTLRWIADGTISAGTVKLQGSNDSTGNCANPTDIIAAQAATSSGTVNGTAGYYKFVQIVTASFAGSGTLRVYYAGNKSSSAIGSAVTVTSGNVAVTNAGTFPIQCTSGCSGGTSDIDDGTIAGGQTTGLSLGLNQVWDGTNWKRFTVGTAGTESTQVITVQGRAGMTPILATVSDGSGALNTIVDSGTITAVTSITNPVTVTDGAGALNVIVDSGTITTVSTVTAVTSITNAVTVTDGAGALNVICDSGCSGGVQYDEDTAHVSGDKLSMAGVVRKDADAALAADGDNSVLQVDETGYLKVSVQNLATDSADNAAFPNTSTEPPVGIAGIYESALPTYASGDKATMHMDSSGRIILGTSTASVGVVDTELIAVAALADNTANPTVTSVGVYNMCFDGTNWDRCNAAATGAGAVSSTVQRVTLASDDPVTVSTQLIDDTIFADEAAFTYTTSKVQAFGAVAESTTDALADGTIGAPVMTLNRTLRTTPTGYSAGGGTGVSYVSVGTSEDEHAVCTGPCTLYQITAMNHTAASAFLRCENDTAGNTTPGSETNAAGEPDIEIPASTTGAGFTIPIPIGVSFSVALTCWIVSDEAATGVTEVAANDVRVWYVISQ